MNEQKSLNNKGFSLVELIIVIAIMAILVGVMAPNLLRYVERANVSADVQLADSVRLAVQTAIMDPNIKGTEITKYVEAHKDKYAKLSVDADTNIKKELATTLAVPEGTMEEELIKALRSAHNTTSVEIQVKITTLNQVIVRITTTDKTGGKDTTGGYKVWITVPASAASSV